jgi:hypothetical protein
MCVYVCMYVCMYVCIYVCMCVCVCIMYVCMYACVYVCKYVCMYVCTHVCMNVFMYVSNPCPLQKSKFQCYVLSFPYNYHDFNFISIRYLQANFRISGQFVSVSTIKRSLKHEIKRTQFRHFCFFWHEKRERNINQHTWKKRHVLTYVCIYVCISVRMCLFVLISTFGSILCQVKMSKVTSVTMH